MTFRKNLNRIKVDGVSQLIILTGNSGSGKTMTSEALQRKLGYCTILISQNIDRREILFVKDGPNQEASQLLLKHALCRKTHCNIVIFETGESIKY